MNVLIITGGSKGIGKAIAEKYALENYTVFSFSRSVKGLKNIQETAVDLTNLEKASKIFTALFAELNSQEINSITLINNAGRLGKIASLGNLETGDIAKSIQLNTTLPLVVSNIFIAATKNWNCKKQIFSISSGAAANPYEGWSVYCTSKAALDMMTKTIAAEQNNLENSVKCVSIYPGVVDTEMQTEIRNTQEKDFKNLQRFIDLKENNELYSPKFVAKSIFKLDSERLLKNGETIRI